MIKTVVSGYVGGVVSGVVSGVLDGVVSAKQCIKKVNEIRRQRLSSLTGKSGRKLNKNFFVW